MAEMPRFNNDLPIDEADIKLIEREFKEIAWIVVDQTLRERFLDVDPKANLAKARARRLGVLAISLCALALLVAAADPLYPLSFSEGGKAPTWVKWLGGGAALLGVIGGLIGWFGAFHGESRDRWLNNRVLTERMRHFHFQFLLRHAAQIQHASQSPKDSPERERLHQTRTAAWTRFKMNYDDFISGKCAELIGDEDEHQFWVVSLPTGAAGEAEPPPDAAIFSYFKSRRFEGQSRYAAYVLREEHAMKAPRLQASAISKIALLCVAILFVIHLVLAAATGLGVDKAVWGGLAHVLAVWLAIIALAAKTFEEGLRPEQEIERMTVYANGIRRLEHRFAASDTGAKRLAVMEELERFCYWELRQFLRTHQRARFSL